MLVFVRRSGDRIEIPSAEVSVRVLGVGTGQVTIGIDAPSGAIVDPIDAEASDADRLRVDRPGTGNDRADGRVSHALRNHLNSVTMALHVIQTQVANEQQIDNHLLEQAIAQLKDIEY